MTIHSSSKHWDHDVRRAAQEVDAKFPRSEWTSTYPGHGEYSPVGAYAVDFMCNRSDGDRIADYVWKHRKRLGVRYVIWYERIISETSNTPNRWVRYFNAGSTNPSKAHRNHVHVSFYPGRTYQPPPEVTAYRPDPDNFGTVYLSKLHPGVKDSDSVWQFQLALIKLGYDIPAATGDYGPKTTAAVKAFQRADKELAVDADGDTGPLTARKVFERAGNVVKVED